MLYIGTAEEIPLESSDALKVESLDARAEGVRQWFSQPFIRFVGAHTGCSCGFPAVIAETEIEYYEGMPLLSDDRGADLRSVQALIELLTRSLADADRVELYPVAHGDESKAPKGRIEWQVAALDPERFFFNERFLHVVRNSDTGR